ncbi:unnamed protein product [Amoebophrya sp. A25]|nr:unnamed protein product [Amoebophrya sp. A25]|eukprot:GSA25T00002707001.1
MSSSCGVRVQSFDARTNVDAARLPPELDGTKLFDFTELNRLQSVIRNEVFRNVDCSAARRDGAISSRASLSSTGTSTTQGQARQQHVILEAPPSSGKHSVFEMLMLLGNNKRTLYVAPSVAFRDAYAVRLARLATTYAVSWSQHSKIRYYAVGDKRLSALEECGCMLRHNLESGELEETGSNRSASSSFDLEAACAATAIVGLAEDVLQAATHAPQILAGVELVCLDHPTLADGSALVSPSVEALVCLLKTLIRPQSNGCVGGDQHSKDEAASSGAASTQVGRLRKGGVVTTSNVATSSKTRNNGSLRFLILTSPIENIEILGKWLAASTAHSGSSPATTSSGTSSFHQEAPNVDILRFDRSFAVKEWSESTVSTVPINEQNRNDTLKRYLDITTNSADKSLIVFTGYSSRVTEDIAQFFRSEVSGYNSNASRSGGFLGDNDITSTRDTDQSATDPFLGKASARSLLAGPSGEYCCDPDNVAEVNDRRLREFLLAGIAVLHRELYSARDIDTVLTFVRQKKARVVVAESFFASYAQRIAEKSDGEEDEDDVPEDADQVLDRRKCRSRESVRTSDTLTYSLSADTVVVCGLHKYGNLDGLDGSFLPVGVQNRLSPYEILEMQNCARLSSERPPTVRFLCFPDQMGYAHAVLHGNLRAGSGVANRIMHGSSTSATVTEVVGTKGKCKGKDFGFHNGKGQQVQSSQCDPAGSATPAKGGLNLQQLLDLALLDRFLWPAVLHGFASTQQDLITLLRGSFFFTTFASEPMSFQKLFAKEKSNPLQNAVPDVEGALSLIVSRLIAKWQKEKLLKKPSSATGTAAGANAPDSSIVLSNTGSGSAAPGHSTSSAELQVGHSPFLRKYCVQFPELHPSSIVRLIELVVKKAANQPEAILRSLAVLPEFELCAPSRDKSDVHAVRCLEYDADLFFLPATNKALQQLVCSGASSNLVEGCAGAATSASTIGSSASAEKRARKVFALFMDHLADFKDQRESSRSVHLRKDSYKTVKIAQVLLKDILQPLALECQDGCALLNVLRLQRSFEQGQYHIAQNHLLRQFLTSPSEYQQDRLHVAHWDGLLQILDTLHLGTMPELQAFFEHVLAVLWKENHSELRPPQEIEADAIEGVARALASHIPATHGKLSQSLGCLAHALVSAQFYLRVVPAGEGLEPDSEDEETNKVEGAALAIEDQENTAPVPEIFAGDTDLQNAEQQSVEATSTAIEIDEEQENDEEEKTTAGASSDPVGGSASSTSAASFLSSINFGSTSKVGALSNKRPAGPARRLLPGAARRLNPQGGVAGKAVVAKSTSVAKPATATVASTANAAVASTTAKRQVKINGKPNATGVRPLIQTNTAKGIAAAKASAIATSKTTSKTNIKNKTTTSTKNRKKGDVLPPNSVDVYLESAGLHLSSRTEEIAERIYTENLFARFNAGISDPTQHRKPLTSSTSSSAEISASIRNAVANKNRNRASASGLDDTNILGSQFVSAQKSCVLFPALCANASSSSLAVGTSRAQYRAPPAAGPSFYPSARDRVPDDPVRYFQRLLQPKDFLLLAFTDVGGLVYCSTLDKILQQNGGSTDEEQQQKSGNVKVRLCYKKGLTIHLVHMRFHGLDCSLRVKKPAGSEFIPQRCVEHFFRQVHREEIVDPRRDANFLGGVATSGYFGGGSCSGAFAGGYSGLTEKQKKVRSAGLFLPGGSGTSSAIAPDTSSSKSVGKGMNSNSNNRSSAVNHTFQSVLSSTQQSDAGGLFLPPSRGGKFGTFGKPGSTDTDGFGSSFKGKGRSSYNKGKNQYQEKPNIFAGTDFVSSSSTAGGRAAEVQKEDDEVPYLPCGLRAYTKSPASKYDMSKNKSSSKESQAQRTGALYEELKEMNEGRRPNCHCGVPAKECFMKKQGRYFWGCSKGPRQVGGCGFFQQWFGQYGSKPTAESGGNAAPRTSNSRSQSLDTRNSRATIPTMLKTGIATPISATFQQPLVAGTSKSGASTEKSNVAPVPVNANMPTVPSTFAGTFGGFSNTIATSFTGGGGFGFGAPSSSATTNLADPVGSGLKGVQPVLPNTTTSNGFVIGSSNIPPGTASSHQTGFSGRTAGSSRPAGFGASIGGFEAFAPSASSSFGTFGGLPSGLGFGPNAPAQTASTAAFGGGGTDRMKTAGVADLNPGTGNTAGVVSSGFTMSNFGSLASTAALHQPQEKAQVEAVSSVPPVSVTMPFGGSKLEEHVSTSSASSRAHPGATALAAGPRQPAASAAHRQSQTPVSENQKQLREGVAPPPQPDAGVAIDDGTSGQGCSASSGDDIELSEEREDDSPATKRVKRARATLFDALWKGGEEDGAQSEKESNTGTDTVGSAFPGVTSAKPVDYDSALGKGAEGGKVKVPQQHLDQVDEGPLSTRAAPWMDLPNTNVTTSSTDGSGWTLTSLELDGAPCEDSKVAPPVCRVAAVAPCDSKPAPPVPRVAAVVPNDDFAEVMHDHQPRLKRPAGGDVNGPLRGRKRTKQDSSVEEDQNKGNPFSQPDLDSNREMRTAERKAAEAVLTVLENAGNYDRSPENGQPSKKKGNVDPFFEQRRTSKQGKGNGKSDGGGVKKSVFDWRQTSMWQYPELRRRGDLRELEALGAAAPTPGTNFQINSNNNSNYRVRVDSTFQQSCSAEQTNILDSSTSLQGGHTLQDRLPLCFCNQPCAFPFPIRKAGENQGKLLYKCAAAATASSSKNNKNKSSSASAFGAGSSSGFPESAGFVRGKSCHYLNMVAPEKTEVPKKYRPDWDIEGLEVPVCNCDKPCVWHETRNQGVLKTSKADSVAGIRLPCPRLFWKCANRRCDFFRWVDNVVMHDDGLKSNLQRLTEGLAVKDQSAMSSSALGLASGPAASCSSSSTSGSSMYASYSSHAGERQPALPKTSSTSSSAASLIELLKKAREKRKAAEGQVGDLHQKNSSAVVDPFAALGPRAKRQSVAPATSRRLERSEFGARTAYSTASFSCASAMNVRGEDDAMHGHGYSFAVSTRESFDTSAVAAASAFPTSSTAEGPSSSSQNHFYADANSAREAHRNSGPSSLPGSEPPSAQYCRDLLNGSRNAQRTSFAESVHAALPAALETLIVSQTSQASYLEQRPKPPTVQLTKDAATGRLCYPVAPVRRSLSKPEPGSAAVPTCRVGVNSAAISGVPSFVDREGSIKNVVAPEKFRIRLQDPNAARDGAPPNKFSRKGERTTAMSSNQQFHYPRDDGPLRQHFDGRKTLQSQNIPALLQQGIVSQEHVGLRPCPTSKDDGTSGPRLLNRHDSMRSHQQKNYLSHNDDHKRTSTSLQAQREPEHRELQQSSLSMSPSQSSLLSPLPRASQLQVDGEDQALEIEPDAPPPAVVRQQDHAGLDCNDPGFTAADDDDVEYSENYDDPDNAKNKADKGALLDGEENEAKNSKIEHEQEGESGDDRKENVVAEQDEQGAMDFQGEVATSASSLGNKAAQQQVQVVEPAKPPVQSTRSPYLPSWLHRPEVYPLERYYGRYEIYDGKKLLNFWHLMPDDQRAIAEDFPGHRWCRTDVLPHSQKAHYYDTFKCNLEELFCRSEKDAASNNVDFDEGEDDKKNPRSCGPNNKRPLGDISFGSSIRRLKKRFDPGSAMSSKNSELDAEEHTPRPIHNSAKLVSNTASTRDTVFTPSPSRKRRRAASSEENQDGEGKALDHGVKKIECITTGGSTTSSSSAAGVVVAQRSVFTGNDRLQEDWQKDNHPSGQPSWNPNRNRPLLSGKEAEALRWLRSQIRTHMWLIEKREIDKVLARVVDCLELHGFDNRVPVQVRVANTPPQELLSIFVGDGDCDSVEQQQKRRSATTTGADVIENGARRTLARDVWQKRDVLRIALESYAGESENINSSVGKQPPAHLTTAGASTASGDSEEHLKRWAITAVFGVERRANATNIGGHSSRGAPPEQNKNNPISRSNCFQQSHTAAMDNARSSSHFSSRCQQGAQLLAQNDSVVRSGAAPALVPTSATSGIIALSTNSNLHSGMTSSTRSSLISQRIPAAAGCSNNAVNSSTATDIATFSTTSQQKTQDNRYALLRKRNELTRPLCTCGLKSASMYRAKTDEYFWCCRKNTCGFSQAWVMDDSGVYGTSASTGVETKLTTQCRGNNPEDNNAAFEMKKFSHPVCPCNLAARMARGKTGIFWRCGSRDRTPSCNWRMRLEDVPGTSSKSSPASKRQRF